MRREWRGAKQEGKVGFAGCWLVIRSGGSLAGSGIEPTDSAGSAASRRVTRSFGRSTFGVDLILCSTLLREISSRAGRPVRQDARPHSMLR
jgi:hypothetical protein